MRRILEQFLALVLSAFLKSSQFRCFLLLLHFVLNFAPPRYNGISTVTLKCIANGRGVFLWLTSLEFSCLQDFTYLTCRLNFGAELDFLDAETSGVGLDLYPLLVSAYYSY